MNPPAFWARGRVPPWPLETLSGVYAAATAWRTARAGWTAPVPVICCGNATAGGSGKTPLALDIGARLLARGMKVAFISRGHGGRQRGPVRVSVTRHDSNDVGDEPLLLAALAPTYVGADRAGCARLAMSRGAEVLVMDDGLQNPGLAKTLSLLVIDGGAGFGNGRVIPAGPLREPVSKAASRCQAAVLIGPDRAEAAAQLPPSLPVFTVRLVPDPEDVAALPVDLFAFAGIGRPEKFFHTLRETGRNLVAARAFPDHYFYTMGDLAGLHTEARRLKAELVTTAKDYIRLAPLKRAGVWRLRVSLEWDDPDAIEALLTSTLNP